jgi:hypothetical protein
MFRVEELEEGLTWGCYGTPTGRGLARKAKCRQSVANSVVHVQEFYGRNTWKEPPERQVHAFYND